MVPEVASNVPLLYIEPAIRNVPFTVNEAPLSILRLSTDAVFPDKITGLWTPGGIVTDAAVPGIPGHQLAASLQLVLIPFHV